LVSRITDAKGAIKHLSYDPWGQLLSYTDCSGQTTRFEYDTLGHMARMTDALGHSTYYQHDARGNLLSVRHPDGGQERYQYDAEGRLTAHTDMAGHTTHWQLAADGLPIKRRNALGHELAYEYDHWRRLVCLRNENKAAYRFAYDSADRLTAQWSFDALLTEFAYSPGGQLLQVKEYGQIEAQDGVPHPDQRRRAEHLIETRFERDAVGRLLAKHIKGRGQALQRTRFVYDVAGQLTRASNADSVVALAYDAAGQLSHESLQAPGLAPMALWPRGNGMPGGREHVLRHAYDALGNRISTTLPDGRVLNTLHYGSGHVHQINIDGQVISDFERDALHRERSRSQGALQSLTDYDALGRISTQQVRWAGASPAQPSPEVGGSAKPTLGMGMGSRIQRHYQYDRAGQLSQIADWQGSLSYRYDPLGQLLSANEERFAFDPAHNLLPATAQPGGSSPAPLLNNRVAVFEDKRYDYDAHGRTVQKRSGSGGHQRTELHWDAQHQLQRSVTHKAGRVTELHYAYDPFGRRIAKYQADTQGRPDAQRSHWYVSQRHSASPFWDA
jgi:YD repeat-containing protein